MKPRRASIGLSGVAGVLPAATRDLTELASAGLLTSSPETLAAFGFSRAHIAGVHARLDEMAFDAAAAAMSDAGLQPRNIDVLIWASARPENQVCRMADALPSPPNDVMPGFRYVSAWLQNELELHEAEVMAVAQQGCSTMFSALRVARSLLVAEPDRHHVLCVAADVLPPDVPREILYNVISDAASAVVVSRDCTTDRWVGYRQISRGYYWNPAACPQEIVAAYFPTAKALIERLLSDHGLRPQDIDVVVPTGVNQSSWEILLRLIGIPQERLYQQAPSFGHTMTSDTFLYLQQLRSAGCIARGSRLLLFTYGFGSSWCGLLLEH
jgi:3-oxoacyl-[acyl-carrier-protein] synthase-3